MAFQLTAANVAEVGVELNLVDQTKVPRPKGAPSNVRPAWLPTKVMPVVHSDTNFGTDGFNPRYPIGNGPTAVVNRAVLPKCIQPARAAGN